jgi:tetratricopeptide (TPR) repeat protein
MVERRTLQDGVHAAGSRIGPYEVVRRIGSGGMGTVYLCRAVESCPVPIGRQVAVKLLRSSDSDERRRFERESRYLQTLQHPGIVRVLDTGEDGDRLYLVMPVIEGKRLDDLVGPKLEPLAESKAIEWMVQALEALHVAHLAGILHRDLKPGNLMLDKDGRIRLLDFGLASAPDYESRLTRDGDVVGTPAYMPPEQAAGRREELSRRSDIYGMGACLYELLTGRQPYEADNAMATLRAIIDEPLLPPSKLRKGLDYDLETVVLVAMAKDQRDRYRTAEEMAGDLRRLRNGLRIRARRVSPVVQTWRSLVRNRRTVAAVSLVVFTVLAGAGLLTMRALRAAKDRAAVVEAATANAWTVEYAFPSADGKLAMTWADHLPFGDGALLAALPTVDGPVRLTIGTELTLAASPGATAVELLIGDRDIGAGYRLRLSLGGAGSGDTLSLLREDRVVASRDLGDLPRGTPYEISLEHVEGTLTATVAPTRAGDSDHPAQTFTFLDLAPLQGPDANGVFVVRYRGQAEVPRVRLERQRSGELVSALATADAFRQDKRYARAQQLYQAFLHDHPGSAQAKDARMRLGLCQEGLGDTAGALTTFVAVAEETRDNPRYVLVATFHAWTSALKLGRYAEAERYFEAIRRSYDLPTLAAAIPQATLRDLRQDYATRATSLASQDPERAMFLALTAAEIAGYLGDTAHIADGTLLAGDLLLALGRGEVARETYLRTAEDARLSADKRLAGRIRLAHADRLLDHPDRAADSYRAALELAPAGQRGRIMLWLGDLAADNNDQDLATSLWRDHDTASDAATLGLLRRLADGQEAIPETDPLIKDPDAAYVNARLMLQAGDQVGALDWLERAANQTPTYRWPAPLARAMLSKLQSQEMKRPEP